MSEILQIEAHDAQASYQADQFEIADFSSFPETLPEDWLKFSQDIKELLTTVENADWLKGLSVEQRDKMWQGIEKIVRKNVDEARALPQKIVNKYCELSSQLRDSKKLNEFIQDRSLQLCAAGLIAQTEILRDDPRADDSNMEKTIRKVVEESTSLVTIPLKDSWWLPTQGWAFVNPEAVSLIVKTYREHNVFPQKLYKFESDPEVFQAEVVKWMKDNPQEWHYLFLHEDQELQRKVEQRYGLLNGYGDSALFYHDFYQETLFKLKDQSDPQTQNVLNKFLNPRNLIMMGIKGPIDFDELDQVLQSMVRGEVCPQISSKEAKMTLNYAKSFYKNVANWEGYKTDCKRKEELINLIDSGQ